MLIVGITGTLGSGKGTIVSFLTEQMNFAHFSVRDYLVQKIIERGLAIDRNTMTAVANDLRKTFGPSHIVDELYNMALQQDKPAIIESIRTPGEVLSLKKRGNFILMAVDADPELRFKRIKLRGSSTDNIDFDTFLANEAREMQTEDPYKQNLSKCIEMSDVVFDNNGNIEALFKQLKSYIDNNPNFTTTEAKQSNQRPNWDEYFMELCRNIGARATCNRGKSGCVIVRNNQLLVTGYVGSPSGLPHCDEVGHQFKKIIHEDGTTTNHCVRTVHAEQNAICQAAKRGISIEGATVYCKMTPCRVCTMLIISCGIKKVICEFKYHAGAESEEMFKAAGIELVYFNTEVLNYK